MQTERVTFLTSREHKTALDAYAASSGQSVGHVVREATSQYLAQPHDPDEREAELAALAGELESALPEMREDFAAIVGTLRSMNDKIEAWRAEKARRRQAA